MFDVWVLGWLGFLEAIKTLFLLRELRTTIGMHRNALANIAFEGEGIQDLSCISKWDSCFFSIQ